MLGHNHQGPRQLIKEGLRNTFNSNSFKRLSVMLFKTFYIIHEYKQGAFPQENDKTVLSFLGWDGFILGFTAFAR